MNTMKNFTLLTLFRDFPLSLDKKLCWPSFTVCESQEISKSLKVEENIKADRLKILKCKKYFVAYLQVRRQTKKCSFIRVKSESLTFFFNKSITYFIYEQ